MCAVGVCWKIHVYYTSENGKVEEEEIEHFGIKRTQPIGSDYTQFFPARRGKQEH